jgi:hypothetical protein
MPQDGKHHGAREHMMFAGKFAARQLELPANFSVNNDLSL